MNREVRCALLALRLLAFSPLAWTQTPLYKGGITYNANPLDPANFPDQDPLQVEPRQLPTVVQGNRRPFCQPPDKSWRLLAQYGNNCLYAAPLSAAKRQLYRNAIIVSKDQISGSTRKAVAAAPIRGTTIRRSALPPRIRVQMGRVTTQAQPPAPTAVRLKLTLPRKSPSVIDFTLAYLDQFTSLYKS